MVLFPANKELRCLTNRFLFEFPFSQLLYV